MSKPVDIEDLISLLEDVHEFLDNYVDVNDGEDGRPVPNRAMSLDGEVESVLWRLKRERV